MIAMSMASFVACASAVFGFPLVLLGAHGEIGKHVILLFKGVLEFRTVGDGRRNAAGNHLQIESRATVASSVDAQLAVDKVDGAVCVDEHATLVAEELGLLCALRGTSRLHLGAGDQQLDEARERLQQVVP